MNYRSRSGRLSLADLGAGLGGRGAARRFVAFASAFAKRSPPRPHQPLVVEAEFREFRDAIHIREAIADRGRAILGL